MVLPDFKLEIYFAQWEFNARYHLTASDAQAPSLAELLSMADASDMRAWNELALGYTETRGAPSLRAAIASTYHQLDADDILVFGGPGEGITTTMRALLDHDDHAIVVLPNYQSAEAVPRSLCDTTGVPLRPEDGWDLDVDAVAAAIKPNTKLVAVNFPNNPTGAVASGQQWARLIDLIAERGIYLFSDEIYRGVEADPEVTLPQAADLYDRAISFNGVSKAYGLPGLRIGWIATRDGSLLSGAEKVKHYGTICSAAPSEVLAEIAIKAGPRLFDRARKQINANLPLFERFFSRHTDLFEWYSPAGGCVSFPRYLGSDGVEAFCRDAVEEAGVLLLPASIFASPLAPISADRFRVGVGRSNALECLRALEHHLESRS